MSDGEIQKGGCLCGEVRWRAIGAPLYAYHCHCRMCQRNSGSAFISGVTFDFDAVAWTRELPARFQSSENAWRLFCPRCGSTVAWQWRQDKVSLMAGSFDEPERIRPKWHVFTESRLSWIHLADGLPTCERYPDDIDEQDQGI